MKKRLVSLFLVLMMAVSLVAVPVFAESDVKVLLDGVELEFDVPAQIIDDRTMVPMRKIFESMGAVVAWDGDTRTIIAVKNEIVVMMQIDNTLIHVNGEKVELDVPPMLVGERTLVPARAVAESLQAKVDWDGETKTVTIATEAPAESAE